MSSEIQELKAEIAEIRAHSANEDKAGVTISRTSKITLGTMIAVLTATMWVVTRMSSLETTFSTRLSVVETSQKFIKSTLDQVNATVLGLQGSEHRLDSLLLRIQQLEAQVKELKK